jgi:hypothetical protein
MCLCRLQSHPANYQRNVAAALEVESCNQVDVLIRRGSLPAHLESQSTSSFGHVLGAGRQNYALSTQQLDRYLLNLQLRQPGMHTGCCMGHP